MGPSVTLLPLRLRRGKEQSPLSWLPMRRESGSVDLELSERISSLNQRTVKGRCAVREAGKRHWRAQAVCPSHTVCLDAFTQGHTWHAWRETGPLNISSKVTQLPWAGLIYSPSLLNSSARTPHDLPVLYFDYEGFKGYSWALLYLQERQK